MGDMGTPWRWEFTDGFRVTSVGPWRETRAEALDDGKGTSGWLACKVETLDVDRARWARQEREEQRG